MSKVYVVTTGCYSDYAIRSIFSTEARARDFMAMFSNGADFNDIEEFELDCGGVDMRGQRAFFVRMAKDGRVIEVEHRNSPYGFEDAVSSINEAGANGFDLSGNMILRIITTDTARAIKIANDRRAQLLAANEWPLSREEVKALAEAKEARDE